jgi:signal recognition particle receptor subunit alpha
MLDAFEILTTSGIVLWRKHYAPISSNVINSLINDVFIEERGQKNVDGGSNPPYKKDKYTLRWTSAKDVGLIFVVGKRRCYGSLHPSTSFLTPCRLFIRAYCT